MGSTTYSAAQAGSADRGCTQSDAACRPLKPVPLFFSKIIAKLIVAKFIVVKFIIAKFISFHRAEAAEAAGRGRRRQSTLFSFRSLHPRDGIGIVAKFIVAKLIDFQRAEAAEAASRGWRQQFIPLLFSSST